MSGRYLFPPAIFDALDRIEPGAGGELQLTDAIALLLADPDACTAAICTFGRYDVGQKIDFLRANVELALDRDDLGPQFAAFLRELVQRRGLHVIPLADAQATDPRRGRAAAAAHRCRATTRSGSCSPSRSFATRAGAAVRQHRAWTATRCAPPTRTTRPARLRVVGELAAGARPDSAVGAGEAIRIMTGAPDARTAPTRSSWSRSRAPTATTSRSQHGRDPGDHVRPAGGDLEPGDAVFEPGTVLTPRTSVCSRASTSTRCCVTRARASVSCRPATSSSPHPGRSRSGAFATRTGRCCSRCSRSPVSRPSTTASRATTSRRSRDRITTAVDECDALLTSGAVSMGDYDYVKVVLERLAAERAGSAFTWMQVAIKPAKPFAFGIVDSATAGAGVRAARQPGVVAGELRAVRPARVAAHGRPDRRLHNPIVRATARTAFGRRPDGKLHLDRVTVAIEDGRYVCERAGFQASNVLSGMARADGLARIPDGKGVAAGDEVEVLLLGP